MQGKVKRNHIKTLPTFSNMRRLFIRIEIIDKLVPFMLKGY
jgi:hypothetical protein